VADVALRRYHKMTPIVEKKPKMVGSCHEGRAEGEKHKAL